MLKVAVAGAHGTGKTTLVAALASSVTPPVCAIQGIPRRLMTQGYKFGEALELDAAAAYYVEQWNAEKSAVDADTKTVLTERTLLDVVAYERANRQLFRRAAFSDPVLNFISCVAFDHINTYDLLVYCPIQFPLENDGIRGGSVAYQRTVDQTIWSLLTDNAVSAPHLVISGSVETRVQQVLGSIRGNDL